MKKTYLMLLAILPFLFQSCLFEDKDLFDKTASERLEEFLAEYKALLSSSENGWLLEYYPDEELTYGGYAYVVNFTDEDVVASFELAEDLSKTVISYYKLTGDDGPVLTFDTYNEYLHYFATPDINDYEAMHGDYEFNIAGKSDDGSEVYLTGKKTGNRMTLRKIDSAPAEYLAKVVEVSDAMAAPAYSLSIGEIEAECEMEYNVIYYSYSVTGTSDGETAAPVELYEGQIPFCFTPSGIHFYEPAEIDGVTYDSMTFKDNTLVSEDGKLVISKIIPPLNQMLVTGDWFISYDNLSAYAKLYFDRADSQLMSSEGESLRFAFMGKGNTVNSGYTSAWGFTFVTDAGYGGQLTMTTSLEGDDKVSMVFAMTGQGDGVYYHNNCGFHYYLNVFGYSSARIFTITADNESAPSYLTLTEDANPDNWVRLEARQVTYK
ncbi:MAG: DUF4302 domain-containing protein [Clostridium sp.]|nr:DUF4302 domain-containing protein [Bacteroides sp.]MCM1197468.1 DUF4302 domain-containing protein [Clostridium sp.]